MVTKRYESVTMGELIDEHARHLLSAGYSTKTIDARKGALKRLEEHLPYGCLFAATEQIEAWLAGMRQRGHSRATVFISDYHARAFYGWATTAGYLDGDPMRDMPRPKRPKLVPKPVTDDEARQALECEGRWRIIGLLAAYQGMRASEIAGAAREHVTRDWTFIPRAKGGGEATVPTHKLVWEAVGHLPPGPLVVDNQGRPVDGHWVSRSAALYYPRVGLPGVRPHRLRHWYATTLLNAGVDIRTVQELLRHASIVSTQGYTQVTDTRRAAAILRLPLMGNGPADDGPVPATGAA